MARSQTTDSGARDDVPNGPTDLNGGSWLAAARRALKEYKADDLQDRAAALTYFGIQSIFPGLLVLICLLGVLGKSATQVVTMILLVAAAVIVVVTGGLAHKVGNVLGLGSTAVTVWDIAKWPVLLIIIGLILAISFWASPNVRRGFQ